MRKTIILWIFLLSAITASAQETYLYARKDSNLLYLDIHRPQAGATTEYLGVRKPTILYVFGGGFAFGARDEAYVLKWYSLLNKHGYTVVAIDYRLGMKGYKMGKGFAGLAKSVYQFEASQQMGVEDVFSAVSYLAAHPELGIDIHNIVLCGSSAGAIISLATAQAIANGTATGLPEGFQFKGVLSYAGAIISTHGAPRFTRTPCPILLFHGTKDRAVAYNHFGVCGRGMWGSDYLAKQLKKKDGNYTIYRIEDRGHDVASYFTRLWPEAQAFLERNVMQGVASIVDATVKNDSLPILKGWSTITPQQMYNGR